MFLLFGVLEWIALLIFIVHYRNATIDITIIDCRKLIVVVNKGHDKAMPFRILSGWLGGTSTAPLPTLRRRRSGIRGTDETATLPVSNAMLEHISASCINLDDRILRNFSGSADSLTNIEDEIDELKAAVQSMRAVTSTPTRNNALEAGAVTENTTNESTQVYGTDNGPVTSNNQSDDMVHIHAQKIAPPTKIPEPAKQSPSPMSKEFPPLGVPKVPESSLPQAIHKTTRKRSYAIAAASSPKGVVLKVGKGTVKAHMVPSPTKAKTEINSASPAAKPGTSSPRFAQPTQATVRRADETLRKDSAADLTSLTGTATGSVKVKAPTFQTERRASQRQKRTSLPQGWLVDSQNNAVIDAAPAITAASDPQSLAANPSPQWTKVQRNKTLSYMSPTKATQRRQIGVVASTAPKPSPSRVQTAKLRIDTNVPASNVATRSGSVASTALSFGNSDMVTSSPKALKPRYRPTRTPVSSLDNTCVAAPEEHYILPDTAEAKAALQGLAVLPSPMPSVQNTMLTRRVSRNDLLGSVVPKLAKANLFRLQDELVADVAARTSNAANPIKRDFQAARALSQNLPRIDPVSSIASTTIANDPFLVATQSLRKLGSGSINPLRPANVYMRTYTEFEKPQFPRSSELSGLRPRSSAQIAGVLARGVEEKRLADTGALRGVRYGERATRPAGTYAPHPQEVSTDSAILAIGPVVRSDMVRELGVVAHKSQSSLRATANEFKPSWLSPKSAFAASAQPSTAKRAHYTTPPNQNGPFASFPTTVVPTAPLQPTEPGIWNVFIDAIMPTPSTINISPPAYISPHSTDTSPPFSELQNSTTLPSSTSTTNSTRWRIRARNSRRPYMWTGSDGREIKYVGHGPDAERDPNSPVSYFDGKRGGRVYERGSLVSKENEIEGAPKMPRRMREWSEAEESATWGAAMTAATGCGVCCHGVDGNGMNGFGAGAAGRFSGM
ncbi:hypothetical protein B0A48_00395 [Cryoendolithus antarcticus]|uniref:Uncharacterized protein n=1 Tax=Cryoendolithus antarcticus TaxID=1507870 RepID=A0A1V8TUL7_9PEZI|nr:hypothetical protein B0A48_00395 [Cryoendolithus antarcticus]